MRQALFDHTPLFRLYQYNEDNIRRFLDIAMAVGIVIAIAEAITAVLIDMPALFVVAIATLGTGVGFFLARNLVLRGEIGRAVITASVIFMTAVFIAFCAVPEFTPGYPLALIMVLILVTPYTTQRELRRLMVVEALFTIAIAICYPFLAPKQSQIVPLLLYLLGGIIVLVNLLTLLLIWQLRLQLQSILSKALAANEDLREAQADLEHQVADRTKALHIALTDLDAKVSEQARLLEENSQQRDLINALSTPVLPVSRHTLVVPLIGSWDHERMANAQNRVLQAIVNQRARHILLDVTGIVMIDPTVAQGLAVIAASARLLGTRVTMVGVRPEIAEAIVSSGVELDGLRTASDVEQAMKAFGL